MKKIINGKRYDTDSSEVVATYSNYSSSSDHCYESLCRTKSGNWFLSGEGGGLSRYGRLVGNGMTGGEDVKPLTPKEAMEWLEAKEEAAIIEKYFSDQIQDA